jgi:hypothetical protein
MLFPFFLNSLTQKCFAHLIHSDQMQMFFDLYPDLKAYYKEDGHSIQLEAFKAFGNDKILQYNKSCKHLKWFSLGEPTLKITKSKISKIESLFHFIPEGFYTYIQMLTNQQRQVLSEEATKQYKINIESNQIESMILSNLTCKIVLYDKMNKIELHGEVSTFNKFPLFLFFEYPAETNKSDLFKKRNSILNQNTLNLKCHASSKDYKKDLILLTNQDSVKKESPENAPDGTFSITF